MIDSTPECRAICLSFFYRNAPKNKKRGGVMKWSLKLMCCVYSVGCLACPHPSIGYICASTTEYSEVVAEGGFWGEVLISPPPPFSGLYIKSYLLRARKKSWGYPNWLTEVCLRLPTKASKRSGSPFSPKKNHKKLTLFQFLGN